MDEIRVRFQRPSNGLTDADHARSRDPTRKRNLLFPQRVVVLAHPDHAIERALAARSRTGASVGVVAIDENGLLARQRRAR
jgi:hypothetical protein